MSELGFSAEEIARIKAEREPAGIEEIEVWPENWKAWDAFLAMQRRWRVVAGMGGVAYLSLLDEAIPNALKRARVTAEEEIEVMRQLNVMEEAALPILNERD